LSIWRGTGKLRVSPELIRLELFAARTLSIVSGPAVGDTQVAGTKTFLPKVGELKEHWYLVDGTDKVVGRLASDIAMILMGKHRPTYTPHMLTGDSVIVIHAEKVKFSGKKWQQKEYDWFTGYTGRKTVTAEERLAKQPDRIIREAVRRMLPKNKLATKMLARLKVYSGAEHPHQAQQPEAKELGV
jgi:large subunit ribosomal protein L13